jgi:hypothetical protein
MCGDWKSAGYSNHQVRRCSATKADQKRFGRNGLWSALQTHLQGVDGATLAKMPERYIHYAALLSRYDTHTIRFAESQSFLNQPAKQAGPDPKLLDDGVIDDDHRLAL